MGTNGTAGRALVIAQNLRRCRPALIFGFMVILISFAFFIAACKRSKAAAPAAAGITSGISKSDDASKLEFSPKSPIESELYSKLLSEFERLGIDPARAVAKAPAGSVNAVFDFTARLAGDAGEQPASVVLTWTEQLTGDYDQNGEVGIPDITPIALSYLKGAQYETQILWTGGKRPVGDPDDDGGVGSGNPPAAGSGAENWRLARIDGDFNGEIGISDVTPIALHYLERLDGHRVYRKRLGEAQFTRLTNPDSPSSPLTIPRALAFPEGATAPDANRPVRCSFTDADAGEGIVIYYTTAFDIVTGQEGPPSNGIAINTATGEVDEAPIAKLTVSPNYGAAPIYVTFDATESFDAEGGIAEYRFDFDADGIIDYSTLDESPPETTSTGKAVEIEPGGEPGIVTVRFMKGDAEYMYPSVSVLDEAGFESHPATAKLGVSYWERELIREFTGSEVILPLGFNVAGLSTDPVTGQLVAFGDSRVPWNETGGLVVAWRNAPGDWRVETVVEFPDPILYIYPTTPFDLGGYQALEWNHLNQPVFVFILQHGGLSGTQYRLHVAERSPGGVWTAQKIDTDKNPRDMWKPQHVSPGLVAFPIVVSESDASGYSILWYDHGEWSIEYTGFTSIEFNPFSLTTVSPARELVYSITPRPEGYSSAAWIARRMAEGNWAIERLDNGEFDPLGSSLIFSPFYAGSGALYYRILDLGSTGSSDGAWTTYLGHYDQGKFNHFKIAENTTGASTVTLENGIACATYPRSGQVFEEPLSMCAAYFDSLQSGIHLQEFAFYEPKEVGVRGGAVVRNLVRSKDNTFFAVVDYTPLKVDSNWPSWEYLITRVDPES